MLNIPIDLPIDHIQAICAQYPIKTLSLFGSILREDFNTQSDVDVLIEFLPDARVTYFDLIDIQDQLAQLIGREVDVLTPNALSPYFRDEVMKQAVVLYEHG